MSKFCNTDKIIENIKDLKKPSYSLYDGEYIKGETDDLGIEFICFSGNGIAGLSYLGVVKALHEKKILNKIKYFVASSCGSIISVLIALGATYDYMITKISNTNFSSFFTFAGQELDRKNTLNKYMCAYLAIPEFIMNYGTCSSAPFIEWFATCFEELGYNKDITFGELYNKTGIHIVITTTCLNTKTTLYLSRSSYPHMKIIDAVNASILLPFLFQPLLLKDPNLTETKPRMLIDGGVLNNTPINACDVIDSDTNEIIGFNRKAIGFLTINNKKWCPDFQEINNIFDYSISVIKTMHNNIHTMQSNQEYYWPRILPIETESIDSIDFDITKDKIKFLIESGYRTTIIYLEKREKMIKEQGPLPTNLFIPNLRLQCCGVQYISDNLISETQIYQTNPKNFNSNSIPTAHLFQ